MIIWLNIGPGQGFHMLMKPALEGKRTLYVGSKRRGESMQQHWSDFDVNYTTFFKLECDSTFDQVIMEELGIRKHRFKKFPLQQSQQFHRTIEFLHKHQDIPILFRPRHGQFWSFDVLHEHLMKVPA